MAYTINANAKNVWIRDNEDTRDLSIQTDASSVYLDNGRTLEQELGEGSMVSNVATVDSAMSKVIDGTLDGVYESGVMYGRSLVNIKKTVEAITMTGSGQYKGFHLRSADMIQDLKTDTDYLFVVNVTSNTLEGSTQYSLDFGNTDPNNPNQQAYFTARHYLPYNALGTYKFVLRTKSSFEDAVFVSRNQILPSCTGGSITFSYMLLEYQEGMENWDIPFFTGLCDVKMPILRNVGKNLINGTGDYIGLQGKDGATTTNVLIGDGSLKRYSYIVKCKPKTTYTLTTRGTANRCSLGEFAEYPRSGARGIKRGNLNTNGTLTITTQSDTQYLVCYSYYRETTHTQSEMDEIVRGLKVQLEESPTQTIYEDHKTNILRTSEEIVLREVGGVCDTYNPLTGEYVKRIGEMVFDGSSDEKWGFNATWSSGDYCAFWQENTKDKLPTGYAICDKLPSKHDNHLIQNNVAISEGWRYAHQNMYIFIAKSKLTSIDIEGLRQWLSQNPITVQYELAEPITTIIEPNTMPFAYENGHIILESGHEGQSLLPTLEYSTVVNRTGQVESVAKTIQTQEKQLTMLEQMLIQNIIGLDYNNTVLALNLEINEVM